MIPGIDASIEKDEDNLHACGSEYKEGILDLVDVIELYINK